MRRLALVLLLVLASDAFAADPVVIPRERPFDIQEVRAYRGTVAAVEATGRGRVRLVVHTRGGLRRFDLGRPRSTSIDVGPGTGTRPRVVLARCAAECRVREIRGRRQHTLPAELPAGCSVEALAVWRATLVVSRDGCAQRGVFSQRRGHDRQRLSAAPAEEVERIRSQTAISTVEDGDLSVVGRHGRVRTVDGQDDGNLAFDGHRLCWYAYVDATDDEGNYLACVRRADGYREVERYSAQGTGLTVPFSFDFYRKSLAYHDVDRQDLRYDVDQRLVGG